MLRTFSRSMRNRSQFLHLSLLLLVSVVLLNVFNHHALPGFEWSGDGLSQRSDTISCRFVHDAPDRCAFVRSNCLDEDAGLLSYLQFYYCSLPHAQPIAFTGLVLWMILLFSTIGIAASDFFSINLSTIANILGMSESMAGVTFLAFGNGSPDVFSTFAAMSRHSGSLAVGELIGAASFITAVVAGSMGIVRPFKVARKSFVRDILFFIVAAAFSMGFLADGNLYLWECVVMVVFYLCYVTFVLFFHWYLKNKRQRLERQTAAMSNFAFPGGDIQETEPYRDDEDTAAGERRSLLSAHGSTDIAALERSNSLLIPAEDEDDEDARNRELAELRNNMRVSKPSLGGRRSSVNPIRPSLVGALEFQAVLSSLEKSRNIPDTLINLRQYSEEGSRVSRHLRATSMLPSIGHPGHFFERQARVPTTRARAVSTNDIESSQFGRPRRICPEFDLLGPLPSRDASGPLQHQPATQSTLAAAPEPPPIVLSPPESHQSSREPSPCRSITSEISRERLAPPDIHASPGTSPRLEPHDLPHITTSSPTAQRESPATSPFPSYFNTAPSTVLSSGAASLRLSPGQVSPHGSYFHPLEQQGFDRTLKWWPHNVLPSPQVLASTLFPTLYTWNDKNWLEKALAILSAPSVFFLVITLPVVEFNKDVEDLEKVDVDPHLNSDHPHHQIPPLIVTDPIENGADGEHTLIGPGSHVLDPTPNGVDEHSQPKYLDDADTTLVQAVTQLPGIEDGQIAGPNAVDDMPQDHNVLASSPKEWNRWLVGVQLFTAPLFVTLIFWANMDEDLDPRNIILPVSICMIVSLVLLAGLLLTTTAALEPPFRPAFCFVGFVVSVTWICTIANEVVGVLKTFGVILDISDAVLGLTIFAVGNSLGDLVADMTVARLGFPVMALSACFGGPMLNILLGIGLGGMYMMIHDARSKHYKNPNRPVIYKPYQIEISRTLLISGITLLVTLVGLLIFVPLNHWKVDRRIGWSLVTLWSITCILNVVVEVTGLGGDIAY